MALLLSCAIVAALTIENRRLQRQSDEYARRIVFPMAGRFVPEYVSSDLTGRRAAVGSPGRPVQLLIFFTTTCPFCRQSLPFWKQLHKDVTADSTLRHGVDLIGISLDSVAETREYVSTHSLPFRTVVFPEKQRRLYNIRSVPQLLIIDQEGKILYTRAGVLNERLQLDSVMVNLRTSAEEVRNRRAVRARQRPT